MNSHNSSRKTSTPVLKSTRLLDQLREQIRYLHYTVTFEDAWDSGVNGFSCIHDESAPCAYGLATRVVHHYLHPDQVDGVFGVAA